MKKGLFLFLLLIFIFTLEYLYLHHRLGAVLTNIEQRQSILQVEFRRLEDDCFTLYKKQVKLKSHRPQQYNLPVLAVQNEHSVPLLALEE